MAAWFLSFLSSAAAAAAYAGIAETHPPRYYACQVIAQYARDEKYFIYPRRDSDGNVLRSFRFIYGQNPVFTGRLRWQRQDESEKRWWAEIYLHHTTPGRQSFSTWIYDEVEGLLATILTMRGTAEDLEQSRKHHETISLDWLRQYEPERFQAIRPLEKRLGGEAGFALVKEKLAQQGLPTAEASYMRWRPTFYRCEETNRISWHMKNFLNEIYQALGTAG